MQVAILVEEDRTQLILHPESEHDRAVITVLAKLPNTHVDKFYPCTGGWTRHDPPRFMHGVPSAEKHDLCIVFDNPKEEDHGC